MTLQNTINNPPRAVQIVQQVLTSSGSYTVPSNLVSVTVECVGGGGGSGGVALTGAGAASASGGGGGGAYSRRTYNAATLGASVSYTVGAAGAGGNVGTNPGQAGGSSSWGAFQSAGGGNGSNSTTAAAGATLLIAGAAGGSPSGGTFGLFGISGLGIISWPTTPRCSTTVLAIPGFGGARYARGGTPVVNNENSTAKFGIGGGSGVIILTEILSL